MLLELQLPAAAWLAFGGTPLPGWISIHFQVQQRKSCDFFSFFPSVWSQVFGWVFFFFFPPRKNFTLLTPDAHLSHAVKMLSCPVLAFTGSDPADQIPAKGKTCLEAAALFFYQPRLWRSTCSMFPRFASLSASCGSGWKFRFVIFTQTKRMFVCFFVLVMLFHNDEQ